MRDIKNDFLLDESIIYLNHGSFGACPKPIFDDLQFWQKKLEFEPAQFITKLSNQYLKQSKSSLAKYINCSADDFIYTTNPTSALNLVIKNLPLKKGDEVLTTNHEYGAMDRTWRYYCKKSKAIYKQQAVSLPLISKEQFVADFFRGLTSKTKVVFISHLTSPSALIFPVKEICEIAKQKGLITIVDGAHIPGHIDLDLSTIKADVYVGAFHKWMLTPKGCSFLFVSKALQFLMDPLVISWGYESETPSYSTFIDYNEYQGTRDISAYLTIPKALEYLSINNWKTRSEECKLLIQKNYPILCKLLETEPICKISDEFLGQMCSIPIQPKNPIALKETLYNDYKIEIPITTIGTNYFIRLSLQAYNSQTDVDALMNAIRSLKKSGAFIFN